MSLTTKKVKPIILILLLGLFIVPINLFYLSNTIDLDEIEENNQDNIENRQLFTAQPKLANFTINGTEYYEYNTFYLFQNDSLLFVFNNESYVTDVYINITLDAGPYTSYKFYFDYNPFDPTQQWNKTVYFNATFEVGEYNATIYYEENGDYRTFQFFLDISNPAPRILYLEATDSSYGAGAFEIVEEGTYSTYRFTDLDFTTSVANRDGLGNLPADAVNLYYKNNTAQSGWNTVQFTMGSTGEYNGIPIKNYSIPSAINIVASKNNDWIPDTYEFYLNVSDDDGELYIFRFYIQILNKPPQITKFDISPETVASGSATEVWLEVNASDLEDDFLYYDGGQLKDVNYTDRPSSAENFSGCDWANPYSAAPQNAIRYQESLDVGQSWDKYANLTFDSAGGEFGVNLTLNQEIIKENITQLTFNLRLMDNESSPTWARLKIYRYGTGWEVINADNTAIDASESAFSIISLKITSNCDEYINNSLIQLILEYQDANDINVTLDQINVTTTLQRRATFSSIKLNIIHSTLLTYVASYDIVNYWDNTQKCWRFNFSFYRMFGYKNGTHTIEVIFYDFGHHNYWEPLWGNYSIQGSEQDGYSGINDDDYFPDNSRSYARSSDVLGVGITQSNVLNFSSTYPNPIVNNTNPDHNEDVNVTVILNNPNALKPIVDGSESFTANDIRLQYHTSLNDTMEVIDQDHSIYGNISLTRKNDGDPWNISLNENPAGSHDWNQSAIVVFWMKTPYWVQDNYTSLRVTLDNYFLSLSSIDNVFIEFWDFENERWITPTGGGDWNSTDAPALLDTKDDGAGGASYDSTWVNNDEIRNCGEFLGTYTKLYMRIRVEADSVGGNSINMSIDYVSIEANWSSVQWGQVTFYYYSYEDESFDYKSFYMNMTALDSTTMQYTYIFNQSELNSLKPDFWSGNYLIEFIVQNGNSSLYIYWDRSIGLKRTGGYSPLIYYNKAEEIPFINVDTILKVKPRDVAYTESVLSDFLAYRYIDEFNVTGNLNLNSTWILNQFIFNIRYNTDTNSTYWEEYRESGIEFTYTPSQNEWVYERSLPVIPKYKATGVYFCRMFIRTVEGQTITTDWKEFRVVNNPPVNFGTNLTLTSEVSEFRASTLSITWQFRDEDNEADVDTLPKVIYLDIYNRYTQQWELWNTNAVFTKISDIDPNYNYKCDIFLDRYIHTGIDNYSYRNIYFGVNDSDSNTPQFSWFNYSNTYITVKNNPPVFQLEIEHNLTSDEIYRNNYVKYRFNVTDIDDIYSDNITVVEGIVNLNGIQQGSTFYDGDFPFVIDGGQGNRTLDYLVARNFELGTLNFSVILNDTDGKEVSDYIEIQVLNNLPQIQNITYNGNTNLASVPVYRKNETLQLRVNLTDVEDSWLGDRFVDKVSIIINHTFDDKDILNEEVLFSDPWIINLTNLVPGQASNNYIECWGSDIVFNVSQAKGIFYAGECSMTVNINDSDTSNVNNYGNALTVLNAAPKLTSVKVWDMTSAKGWYIPENITVGDNLNITLFLSDHEGISTIEVTYEIFSGGIYPSLSVVFDADDWVTGTVNGTQYYSIILDMSEFEVGDHFKLRHITIHDIDYGLKHNDQLGATYLHLVINEQISILEKGGGPPGPDILGIALIVGTISGISAAAIFSFWYYRKRLGYRKYMD